MSIKLMAADFTEAQLPGGIHPTGVISALVALRRSAAGAIRELVNGATIFGFTAVVPDSICALSKWSNGYVPF
ncbi:MAG: hypothetical protein IAF58_00960 [Leptolyngbya sp.]|nr:hypothetical protein [Candidatus Melainabacteria bacterium]